MKYKVYELEAKETKTGKQIKKLVLQGEGKQYPDKQVTMWSDHPLFESVAVGQTIDVELDIKDSTTPNPHGGFYKNKTVIGKKDANQIKSDSSPVGNSAGLSEIKNLINFGVIEEIKKNAAAIAEVKFLIQALGDRFEKLLAEDKITTEDVPF